MAIKKSNTMDVLYLDTRRDAYSVRQCGSTITVGELIEYLNGYNEDTPIYFRNDNGYTYGYITESDFTIDEYEED